MQFNDNGIYHITKERDEQIKKHGRSIQQDVENNDSHQLLTAARGLLKVNTSSLDKAPLDWNANLWEKMKNKSYKERLIIAGALIAAEIDRVIAVEGMEDNKKYKTCGGCGATHPRQRCIGCMHDF